MLISVIGGDKRFLYAAKRLSDLGHTVLFAATEKPNSTIEQALKSQAIVLPMPVSRDRITLNAPLFDKSISLCDILSQLDGKQILLGGITNIDYPNYYDYYNNEGFLCKNSAVTAEGAIQTAFNNTDYSLTGSRVLVVGYGKLGKALCKRLLSFECMLTASARKHSDFEQICRLGINCVNTLELEEIINDFDIVFNTVPYPVLDKQVLRNAKRDTLFIELASAPYGIDLEYAKEQNLCVKLEASLPSRCAPKSAGEFIADTVNDILHAI